MTEADIAVKIVGELVAAHQLPDGRWVYVGKPVERPESAIEQRWMCAAYCDGPVVVYGRNALEALGNAVQAAKQLAAREVV